MEFVMWFRNLAHYASPAKKPHSSERCDVRWDGHAVCMHSKAHIIMRLAFPIHLPKSAILAAAARVLLLLLTKTYVPIIQDPR